MRLKSISLRDKATFERYLKLRKHELSVYNFTNIYIWKKIFKINWALIDNSLCVFFQDGIGAFLYLPPLGRRVSKQALQTAFETLDKSNKNKDLSRIENIEHADRDSYIKAGYMCKEKYPEYLYSRVSLIELKGNAFKSKRAAFNYFTKNYKYEYLPFSSKHKKECLSLYNCWARERASNASDAVYKGMLLDTKACFKVLLDNFSQLGVVGRVVKISGEIKAMTFGFELSKNTFVTLYEVTDLSINGLAQFIFREFARELKKYDYINAMDDSGLENLARVKLSYRPINMVKAYIATRAYA